MDHIPHFREMSIRRIVGLAFGASGLCWAASFGAAALLFFDTVQRPALWGLMGAGLGLMAIFWFLADRLIRARYLDHRSLPARPEFYDFQDLNQPMHWDEISGADLKSLNYVVFDTETTGLFPSKGDEIISIAAVRIQNGIVNEVEVYSRLVHPGMVIPKDSIQYDGITDDMIKDEPPIGEVLPSFREFVGDAILVAHNAAFDMKFLKLKEQATGITFPNLVLDTLLLSVFLDHESHNHTLDGIAQQMGIVIEGRHTALGDSIATAQVFRKMLNRLEGRGITSLRRVVEACSKIEHVRKMQENF